MSAPAQPQVDPADLWDWLVYRGLSEKDATAHVLRVVANSPDKVREQYLKDIDPGKLASFGLGMADMMSFGLGDQAARKLLGETATMTQEQAKAQHPTAHLAGEIAGVLTPAGAELALVKAGKLTPSALRLAINAIKSKTLRAGAKTAMNAAIGAGYAGAQAAGRTEGGIGERARAAGQAAPYGAAAGAALPIALAAGAQAVSPVSRYVGRVVGRIAGKEIPRVTTEGATKVPGLLTVGEELGVVPMRRARPVPAPIAPQVSAPAQQVGQLAVPGRPDLGVLVPAGPTQTAGPAVRTASPRVPSNARAQQMQLVVEALKDSPRSEWPKILEPFKALGMLTDDEIAQLLALP